MIRCIKARCVSFSWREGEGEGEERSKNGGAGADRFLSVQPGTHVDLTVITD